MQIDHDQRRVAAAVKECAAFRLGPGASGDARPARWRAELGQVWHDTLRTRLEERLAADEGPSRPRARFEVPVRGSLLAGEWRFDLQGRLDQVVEDDTAATFLVREVKTVALTLPRPPDELRAAFPDHFLQLAIYLRLAAALEPAAGRRIAGEVVFVDIHGGIVQPVGANPDDDAALGRHLGEIALFLEDRRGLSRRLRSIDFHPPFATWRPGQQETRDRLLQAGPRQRVVMLEAPTGFGKTGTLLDHALHQLKSGFFDRLVYVTGKSTGQLEVVRQLAAMMPDPSALPTVILRNRLEHAIRSPLHVCDDRGRCRRDGDAQWQRASLGVPHLLAEGPMQVERARELGSRHAVCPYLVSRACLPFAAAWVGDYHYVFAPASRSVFLEVPGADTRSSLLVVDEAHNLPERVADACSGSLRAGDLVRLATELQLGGGHPGLPKALLALADAVGDLPRCDSLDPGDLDVLLDLLEPVRRAVADGQVPEEGLFTGSVEQLWEIAELATRLGRRDLVQHPWCRDAGVFVTTCLDAAPLIAERLGAFGQVILASATLGSPEEFAVACGLPPSDPLFIEAAAPWRDGAYRVAVDARPDTRFNERRTHLVTTAETVQRVASHARGPIVVFFPSYAYADLVRVALEALGSGLRVMEPIRGGDLESQRRSLEEALLTTDVMFFVLGTGFSEGIDLLGGRVSDAIVVSPALPEVSPPREALRKRREAAGLSRTEAFDEVYLNPGIRRINQALGRLVRAPGHRARVLLHCRRFASASAQSLLADPYRGGPVLRTTDDLEAWLTGE